MYDGLFTDTTPALPPGWTLEEVMEHGSSSWSTGYKLSLTRGDKEKEYFLKVRSHSCPFT